MGRNVARYARSEVGDLNVEQRGIRYVAYVPSKESHYIEAMLGDDRVLELWLHREPLQRTPSGVKKEVGEG